MQRILTIFTIEFAKIETGTDDRSELCHIYSEIIAGESIENGYYRTCKVVHFVLQYTKARF